MTRNDRAESLVRKLWHYCNVLRDDGLSYPDYVEQLTYLLFLKMADEQDAGAIPVKFGWRSFSNLNAAPMHAQYGRVLATLGNRKGVVGLIFKSARNKINDPAKLRLLVVDLIGQTEWTGLSGDLKGDAYEGLLEKNARDTKSGAGQYFTPRPLVQAIVECVRPRLGEVICDPACGTGGFLLAANHHLRSQYPKLTSKQRAHLATRAFRGVELVPEVARLATMNLLLHGVEGGTEEELPISCADSLREIPGNQVSVVLTNPPFGVKGSITYAKDARPDNTKDDLIVKRPDFWVETANKQLNFLQHVVTLLKPGGRAAVVVPDNVLFEGGAAEAIRRRLLESLDLHTILRLPSGLFYAQGVQANVIFFDNPAKKKTTQGRLWVYDLRSGKKFSLKANPIQSADLSEFVELYRPEDRYVRTTDEGQPRWRVHETSQLLQGDHCRLDMDVNGPAPTQDAPTTSRLDEIAELIAEDLQQALSLIGKASGRRAP